MFVCWESCCRECVDNLVKSVVGVERFILEAVHISSDQYPWMLLQYSIHTVRQVFCHLPAIGMRQGDK